MYLLTTDLHLDDQSANEYRWQIFDYRRSAKAQHDVSQIFLLGDPVDRKDRFTAAVINRLLAQLKTVAPIAEINYDTRMRRPASTRARGAIADIRKDPMSAAAD